MGLWRANCHHSFAAILGIQHIGKNFSHRHSTTLGNKGDTIVIKPDGAVVNNVVGNTSPIIGDNVTLGANVVIIGDITIGNNVMVEVGSIVAKSVPDNCILVGNPARILRQNV